MKRIFNLLGSLILLSLWACSGEALHYSSDFDPATSECVSIAYLNSLSTDRLVLLNRSLYIEAVVTANDHYGEFPHALFVQDHTAALEIKIAGNRLYTRYPLGLKLRIFCDGLLLGSFREKILLGDEADQTRWPTAISAEDAARRLHPLEGPYERLEPRTITLPLGAELHVGELVRLDGLTLLEADGAETWCTNDPLSGELLPTFRTLSDGDDNLLPLYVEATSTYATEPLPMGRGSFTGILDYKEGGYCLRLVNRDIRFE
uniref:DUF5689 domain-containing protein n=1 Tax=Alistipes sp. TaxID=1872444 RepID=UPI004055BF0F